MQSFTLQPDHFVARYGGDEMMMVLSDTTAWKAAEMSERIRLEISEMAALELSEDGPTVTLSLGIAATIPSENLSPDVLIKRADEALYQAKAAGRNKTVIWK
ncbi:diguanylate cyclase domain-containing protein [Jeotgalibaca porci]|uniref:diguanylate cyclase domain-containing protein n=1 Tax=Jeotgalibaca porci TaxID=1868793 RepID=UPI0035A03458